MNQEVKPKDKVASTYNGKAIAATIFTFLLPLVGLLLGIASISEINRTKQKGKGLAVASIVVSSAYLLLLAIRVAQE